LLGTGCPKTQYVTAGTPGSKDTTQPGDFYAKCAMKGKKEAFIILHKGEMP